ncbi:MAG: DUF1289 domain-containing protein [Motiliproteus sp.]|nr:DUF1289 domain-containing protein [Motiliproteus sp.]MCW9052038.1 DUF1289 domain-containing protein [Motiliproteus sp.]
MKFNPCVNQCTDLGTHCEGCGRSHEEIRATQGLVKNMVQFMQQMGYENPEEFARAVANKAVKKYLISKGEL